MNRNFRILLASAALALALPAATMADTGLPSPIEMTGGNITESQIERGLLALGYTDTTYIAGAGRYYTVHTHYDGRPVQLQVDAATGKVTSPGL